MIVLLIKGVLVMSNFHEIARIKNNVSPFLVIKMKISPIAFLVISVCVLLLPQNVSLDVYLHLC